MRPRCGFGSWRKVPKNRNIKGYLPYPCPQLAAWDTPLAEPQRLYWDWASRKKWGWLGTCLGASGAHSPGNVWGTPRAHPIGGRESAHLFRDPWVEGGPWEQ